MECYIKNSFNVNKFNFVEVGSPGRGSFFIYKDLILSFEKVLTFSKSRGIILSRKGGIYMIHITKHTGKLENIVSINTSSFQNHFCMKMSENKESICSKCYGIGYEKLRPTLRNRLDINGQLLSERLLETHEIPFLNYCFVRLNSFGDLINETHLLNLYKVAKKNKHTRFSLFTKRYDLVMKHKKLSNVTYIASSPFVNKEIEAEGVKEFFDKTFTVYSKGFALDNLVKINCGKLKCFECLTCYKRTGTKEIKELLK